MITNGVVSPRELRIAAEHADGLRDRKLRLAYREWASTRHQDARRGIVILEHAAEPGDIELGIDVGVDPDGIPDRMTKPKQVSITYERGPDDLTDLFDALFWSAAAIEKFLLPYYVRLLTPKEFDVLRNSVSDSTVRAIGHFKPTVYTTNPKHSGTSGLVSTGPLTGDGLLGLLTRKNELIDSPSEAITFEEYLQRVAQR